MASRLVDDGSVNSSGILDSERLTRDVGVLGVLGRLWLDVRLGVRTNFFVVVGLVAGTVFTFGSVDGRSVDVATDGNGSVRKGLAAGNELEHGTGMRGGIHIYIYRCICIYMYIYVPVLPVRERLECTDRSGPAEEADRRHRPICCIFGYENLLVFVVDTRTAVTLLFTSNADLFFVARLSDGRSVVAGLVDKRRELSFPSGPFGSGEMEANFLVGLDLSGGGRSLVGLVLLVGRREDAEGNRDSGFKIQGDGL